MSRHLTQNLKQIEVLVSLDQEIGHYIVEGVNVDYLSCYGMTIPETLASFKSGFFLTLSYNVGKGSLSRYICQNPEPYLHYFDDGTFKHFIAL